MNRQLPATCTDAACASYGRRISRRHRHSYQSHASAPPRDPFRTTRDEDHPIRWSSAGGNDPDRFLSIEDAADRIARYSGTGADAVAADLLDGRSFRTPFAFYFTPLHDEAQS